MMSINFKAFNIPISIGLTWWILMFLIIRQFQPHDLMGYIEAAFDVFTFTFFVLAHELSHSLVARKFKKETSKIYLHFIGGTAIIPDVNSAQPIETLFISSAGPILNFVSAATLSGIGLI